MSPQSDFEEFLKSLNSAGVRYLIVGGYALAYHAVPRFTKDLDVLVEPTPANAEAVLNALKDFGFASLNLETEDFSTPGKIVQIGYPPNRIDLINSADGVDFKSAWRRRVRARFGSVSTQYLSMRDLMASKKAAGRPQDQLDLKTLERTLKRRKRSS